MRRRPALLALPLAATALAGALAGCGADPRATGDGVLTVQAAGGEGELAALGRLVEAFEAARPGVRVELVGVPDQGDHVAKLATAFAGGAPPDVFLLNYRRLGPFVERGVLAPVRLEELTTDELYPQAVEAFTYDGELACLPQNVSSSVAYLNTDLLAEAGLPLPAPDWTWDDLQQTATALAAAGVPAVGFAPEVRTVAPFVWSAGGEVVDDTDAPTRMTLDTPEARAALTFLDGLQDFGVDATARAAEDPVDAFAGGRLAVFVDSRRSVPAFRSSGGLAFDVRPLPQVDAATPSVSLLASDAYCVSRQGDTDLAADFAEFAVGLEGAPVLAASGRTVPSLRALAASDAFLAPDEQPASSQVFLDVVPGLRRLPHVGPQDEAEEAANDLLAQFFARALTLDETVAAVGEATAAAYGRPG